MNNSSIRFRLRGKPRAFVLLTCAAAALFLVYKALIDEVDVAPGFRGTGVGGGGSSSSSTASKRTNRNRGPGAFEDVNDLMPITQPREHLERMRQQEDQMLRNVQKIIHHRIKETANRTKNSSLSSNNNKDSNHNNHGGRSKPPLSLWDGIGDNNNNNNNDQLVPKHVLKRRLVHLDLKGAPPTVDYLERLFPLLRNLGATGLLMEYEDMFPYWGELEDARAHNAYSAADLSRILRLAADHDLEVIPLVQTFGHMEFVLKRERFKSMREVPAFPQAACPSSNRTAAVVRLMIDQVLGLHPGAKHLHVGLDEVYNVGECPVCQARMERAGWSTEALFLAHAEFVARHVRSRGVQPVMWDDMFRGIAGHRLRDIGKLTDVLVWKYGDGVVRDLPADLWRKYAENFAGVWVASAFKGAARPASVATPIAARLQNHMAWMQAVEELAAAVDFKGIMLTGWQRYDHFAALCELLPAGLPSLAVNLQYLQHLRYDAEAQQRVQALLGCDRAVILEPGPDDPDARCNFPGAAVYALSLRFVALEYYLNEQFFESNYIKGWVSDYHVRMRFSSPPLLEQAVMRYGDGVRNVSIFQAAAREALADVYDKYTVAEWLEINTRPLLKRLDEYMAAIKLLLGPNTWARRPIGVSVPEPRLKEAEVKKRFQHAVEP